MIEKMNNCDYCGEYTKVRIKSSIIGNNVNLSSPFFDFICEKCSEAKDIEYENAKKKLNQIRLKEQKDWIKKRDKLLKDKEKYFDTIKKEIVKEI